MKKGSKAAKAWGAKMRRLRGSGTKRKKSTRKGQRRKTARRAYEGLKRKAKSYKRKKSRSSMKISSLTSKLKTGTLGKVLIGLGAAQAAALAVGIIAPQYIGIAKPVAALAAGGIPGVAAELVIDQGILGGFTNLFSGGQVAGGGGL